VSHLESCYTQNQTYVGCDAAAGDVMNSGLPVVTVAPGQGQVQVTGLVAEGYEINAKSKSGTTFTITKAGGTLVKPYTCDAADKGGCGPGGKW
jgi:type IV pilus assembly protein PilA